MGQPKSKERIKMKILVTGGTGVLGRPVIQRLVKSGHTSYCIGPQPRQNGGAAQSRRRTDRRQPF